MKVTAGTVNDCTEAEYLMENIEFQKLLADKAFDTNHILELIKNKNAEAVIPSKSNRKEPREIDKELYKKRHLVENAIMHLKRWRGIATRYAKNTIIFLAAVQICCIFIWSKAIISKSRVNTV